MTKIKATVFGAEINLQVDGPLTSGMVGLPIEFAFDESWDGLKKTAVFRASGLTKDRLDIEKETTVPWEVMEKTGCCLQVGVYGTNEDGSLAIPTVWGKTEPIKPGADPSDDKSADPSLPVWAQIQKDLEETNSKIDALAKEMEESESVKDAVLYTEQDLTPEQQAQARENIGALGAKTSNRTSVYAVNAKGEQILVGTSPNAANNGMIPIYNNNGTINVATPSTAQQSANKGYVDGLVGYIETALDSIIATQNELIGGDAQ